jgi:Phosphatidylserine decarboxylase
VYGENVRKIVPIDSQQFGRVMAVCVGAMMVGSIQTTVEEGESVQRGQEFGYFAFGMLLPFLSSIFLKFHPCNPKVVQQLWFFLKKVWFNGTKTFLSMDVRRLKLWYELVWELGEDERAMHNQPKFFF